MLRFAAAAAALAANAAADQQSLDCPLRQIGLDMAQQLQPWRPASSFQQVADALNGAIEAQNCNVQPKQSGNVNAKRMLSFELPTSDFIVYVDPTPGVGSDVRGTGSVSRPLSTLQAGVQAIRAARAAAGHKDARSAPQAYMVLRKGTFYLGKTGPLTLEAQDSSITFQAYPGEEVFISGAVPLETAQWTPVVAPSRQNYDYRPGQLGDGFNVYANGTYTIAAAESLCNSLPQCAGFTYAGPQNPTGPVQVTFKSDVMWSNVGGWSSYVRNYGYGPGETPALYSANIGAEFPAMLDIDSLRVDGVRAIRARYPNVRTAEQLGAMQIVADHWDAQTNGTAAAYTFNPSYPVRNESINDGNGIQYFSEFRLGIGGACASRFTPQASYWCSNYSQGGGPGPYQAPVGMTVNNGVTSLPHTPYQGDVSRAAVHSWRAGRWFSWVFGIGSQSANGGSTTFSFVSGGHQGSRGGNAGQEFFIENVLDELDAPGEFFYDMAHQTLYLWFNGTSAPATSLVEVPIHHMLINATGTQANPVVNVGFLGLGFKDSKVNYLGAHGTPAGGDWAVERAGALFFEGTSGVLLDGCYLVNLDANAVFFSGYNRNATVQRSEFYQIGETAISQWGYTDGSPVPGMGFDGTAGNQPRGTKILYNLVHEVGIWTKQNSFYFQSESGQNTIQGNIAYNGPRAGVNFDDGFLGGSALVNNVLFNFCRESSDHGPFNSWNRQVYLFDDPITGQPTTRKQNDTIAYNWILANYHSSMAIDNDDGSSWYDTHHNVLISASSGSAYGGNSLKSDFGGHANYHHDNLDLFWSTGFGINGALPGFQDGYYGNYLYKAGEGNYGNGQVCTGPSANYVYGNTIWSPAGNITECGMSLAAWQKQGGDPGTVAAPYPSDDVILNLARQILNVPAQ